MRLAHRITSLTLALLVAVSVLTLTGCDRFQARQLIREGNEFFKAEQYEDALKRYQEAQKLDPGEVRLLKFVGYAAMAMYQPGSTHEKDLEFANLAIENFKKYLATLPKDQDKVSQFLVTMYMNSNKIDDAIAFFKQWASAHPDDEQAVMSIAMLYAKQADYQSTVSWQQKRINLLLLGRNPTQLTSQELSRRLAEAYYTLGVTCWQKSYDSSEAMLDVFTRKQVLDRGMEALNKAIEVRANYSDAMAYVNLIYRQYAKWEPDEAKKATYTSQADEWLKKAIEARAKEKEKEREEQAKSNLLEAI